MSADTAETPTGPRLVITVEPDDDGRLTYSYQSEGIDVSTAVTLAVFATLGLSVLQMKQDLEESGVLDGKPEFIEQVAHMNARLALIDMLMHAPDDEVRGILAEF